MSSPSELRALASADASKPRRARARARRGRAAPGARRSCPRAAWYLRERERGSLAPELAATRRRDSRARAAVSIYPRRLGNPRVGAACAARATGASHAAPRRRGPRGRRASANSRCGQEERGRGPRARARATEVHGARCSPFSHARATITSSIADARAPNASASLLGACRRRSSSSPPARAARASRRRPQRRRAFSSSSLSLSSLSAHSPALSPSPSSAPRGGRLARALPALDALLLDEDLARELARPRQPPVGEQGRRRCASASSSPGSLNSAAACAPAAAASSGSRCSKSRGTPTRRTRTRGPRAAGGPSAASSPRELADSSKRARSRSRPTSVWPCRRAVA